MDFVSADRSRDAEFQAGLKNYNFGVAEVNRQITKDINNDRDTEKQQLNNIEDKEIFTQIKDATGGATGIASATATFNNIKEYGEKIDQGVKKAQKIATDTAEKIQQAKPTTEVPEPQVSGEPVPEGGAPKSKPPAQEGILSGEAEEGGGALSKPSEVDKLYEAGKVTAKAGEEGEEAGSLIGKVGTKALKGVGVVGSIAGMGMAIASDSNGGWAKMSLADKIGNGAEIGGAGLDLVGAGLEATGVGIPLGLALQGFGTLLQLGSGIEGEITSKTDEEQSQKLAKQEEQTKEGQEPTPQTQVTSVSGAQAGTLGVARQQQN